MRVRAEEAMALTVCDARGSEMTASGMS
jgi:hypothetical protein